MPFRQITGHRPVLDLLARAVSRGSVPPTLIFAGPEGVGKRRTAIALAQALNCETPEVFAGRHDEIGEQLMSRHDSEIGGRPISLGKDACGRCPSCMRIARGVHADVLVVEPGDSGSIKIDQVRDAIDRAAYRPFEGRRRVVIVDGADALVGEAQNALLKTLEEPPPSSVFVLVTSRPDLLLPTVRSRGHRLRFGALSESDVAAVLMKDHGFSDADAHAAAATSDGSIGRALEANSADLADAREEAGRLLQHAARVTDPVRRIDAARDLTANKAGATAEREQLGACLRALASLLRDTSILALGGDRRMLGNTDLESTLLTLSRTFDAARSMRAYSAVDEALAALEKNVSPKVVADWLVLQL